jgi:hypothetical protein
MSDEQMTPAVRVWNRAALDRGGSHPGVGDKALAHLLVIHGLIMNGGLWHVLDARSEEEIGRGIEAFRYFGLDGVAELLAEALLLYQQETEDEEPIEQLNAKYDQLIPSDEYLVGAFERRFSKAPQDFAPLD